MNNHKLLNLIIVLSKDRSKILLGMKKRGFGKGRWNGFGGKVEEGEDTKQAAVRELAEEIEIKPKELELFGTLIFYEADSQPLEVHIFLCNDYQGEPKETEEMRPKWFSVEVIPYQKMWPDDKYWLPMLLKGKKFKGKFYFQDQNNTDKITNYRLEEVKSY